MRNLAVRIYSDETENTNYMVAEFRWPGYTNLTFGTLINGGFGSASFNIHVDSIIAKAYYRTFMDYHVIIVDHQNDRLYEGAVEDISIIPGGIKIKTQGYFIRGNDRFQGNLYPQGTVASTIIRDCISLIPEWDNVYADVITTTTALPELDFTEEEKVKDVIDQVIGYGYDDGLNDIRALYFAIWDYRKPVLFPEPRLRSVEPDWNVFSRDMEKRTGGSFARSAKNVINRLWVRFDDPAIGSTTTSVYEDKASQNIFGVREDEIKIGEAELGTAEVVAQLALKRYAFPQRSEKATLKGTVRSLSGYKTFPYHIRAGDIIQESEFDAAVINISGGDQAYDHSLGTARAIVTKTTYNDENGSMTLELGTNATALDAYLVRLGLNVVGM